MLCGHWSHELRAIVRIRYLSVCQVLPGCLIFLINLTYPYDALHTMLKILGIRISDPKFSSWNNFLFQDRSIACCPLCNHVCLVCRSRSGSPPCVTSEVRDSIEGIRKFRNLLHHMVATDFHELSSGILKNGDFPDCHTLGELWNECSPHVLKGMLYLLLVIG